jgi:hypothetical protein
MERDNHPFPHGTKVITNNDYLKQFGRRVIGESVFLDNVPVTEHVTIVRWEHQEGNIIPDHQGNMVLMMTRDLERYWEV